MYVKILLTYDEYLLIIEFLMVFEFFFDFLKINGL